MDLLEKGSLKNAGCLCNKSLMSTKFKTNWFFFKVRKSELRYNSMAEPLKLGSLLFVNVMFVMVCCNVLSI